MLGWEHDPLGPPWLHLCVSHRSDEGPRRSTSYQLTSFFISIRKQQLYSAGCNDVTFHITNWHFTRDYFTVAYVLICVTPRPSAQATL